MKKKAKKKKSPPPKQGTPSADYLAMMKKIQGGK